jgi:hypothetical protein
MSPKKPKTKPRAAVMPKQPIKDNTKPVTAVLLQRSAGGDASGTPPGGSSASKPYGSGVVGGGGI